MKKEDAVLLFVLFMPVLGLILLFLLAKPTICVKEEITKKLEFVSGNGSNASYVYLLKNGKRFTSKQLVADGDKVCTEMKDGDPIYKQLLNEL